MINFERHILNNGLKVIVHTDVTTPLVAVNVLYNVGARDEQPNKTGFAHLFEHLMFGGSKNIPNFDEPLQNVGGENNAFTNNDITNYYITLPANNIETAFWLESDRMLELDFSQKILDVQKNVVVEEFKQRYLNQPYGDIPLLVRPLAYKVHPYQWPTIGKELSHIENATLEDVKSFFYSHYAPNNAVLAVTGNVTAEHVFRLAEKWFGDIPARDVVERNLPQEPVQTEFRSLSVERDVPAENIQMMFHIGARIDAEFYANDLLTDIMASGQSSRLYQSLVKKQQIFSETNAYITPDFDPGLLTVMGKLMPGVTMQQAEEAIWAELEAFKTDISDYEFQKVQNKAEANLIYAEVSFLNKAMALAQFEIMGGAELINQEAIRYRVVSKDDVMKAAQTIFRRENCSTLYYNAKIDEVL